MNSLDILRLWGVSCSVILFALLLMSFYIFFFDKFKGKIVKFQYFENFVGFRIVFTFIICVIVKNRLYFFVAS